MPNDPIICHCDEGCGLPHIHRNPPYDTDGRNEMHRKMREERVVEPPTRLPIFECEGLEPIPPLSPNEQERLQNASSRMEICAIELSRGFCENTGCLDEKGGARKATLRVGRYNLCEMCADDRDRGKAPDMVEPRIKLEDLK
jgi:hypothetical protein